MIVSVHIADVGARHAPALLRKRLRAPGLSYSELTTAAPLGGGLLPRPALGRAGLIAAWEDDAALDRFLGEHPVAQSFAGGWHARMHAVRCVGEWSGMPWLPREPEPMEPDEKVAVLTLGRVRFPRFVPFLRASAAAEELVVGDPAVLASTALARPPRFVSTFSLWRSVDEMRAYATGRHAPGHTDAMKAHSARPFHHESAFVRLRPYASAGQWDGREPLAA
jgi:hypothetical protein